MMDTTEFFPVITHVAIDEQGNEIEISAEESNGLIQDTEYSDAPEGN